MFENLGRDLYMLDDDLAISASGDLDVTEDGRTCLLQDVRNLLDLIPGDLFGHPDAGAGVSRLAGEEDIPEFDALVVRAITDALIYDDGVGPRIEQESIVVYPASREGREVRFQVSFQAIGEEWTNRMNLVWGFDLDASTV